MSHPAFLVIIGSVRPKRIGPDVARWVAQLGRAATGATFEPVNAVTAFAASEAETVAALRDLAGLAAAPG